MAFQLLPSGKAGRSILFDLSDDDADAAACKVQLLQMEEEYKDVHHYHSWVSLPCGNPPVSLFHFSENLPEPHPLAIPTPPPDLTRTLI